MSKKTSLTKKEIKYFLQAFDDDQQVIIQHLLNESQKKSEKLRQTCCLTCTEISLLVVTALSTAGLFVSSAIYTYWAISTKH